MIDVTTNINMVEHLEVFSKLSEEKETLAKCLRALADKLDAIPKKNDPIFGYVTQGVCVRVNIDIENSVHAQVFFD